jgi:hypothetical protein
VTAEPVDLMAALLVSVRKARAARRLPLAAAWAEAHDRRRAERAATLRVGDRVIVRERDHEWDAEHTCDPATVTP